ncbi:MAG: ribonuclease R [Ignavibacteriales bacterium]|nr:ribonuclease R [Ignavibacteriales bacterium]
MKKEVVAFFKKNPQAALKTRQLAKKLQIFEEHEYQNLKAARHQLVEEKILERLGKKFKVFVQTEARNSITGTLQITRQGFGFVLPDQKKFPDVFISERNLSSAMNGDKVEVILFARQKQNAKNLEGEITRVVKRRWELVPGTLRCHKTLYYVTPDTPDFQVDIFVEAEDAKRFKEGQQVLVGEIEWVSKNLNPKGKIVRSLNKQESLEDEYMGIISEFNLKEKFPVEVVDEAKKVNEKIPATETKKRVDFRKDIVITIDPVDAKDFDDALSIKQLENGNFSVGIHIADVSHYVVPGSPLDIEANKRGNSVYLAGKVLPMLPEELSNGICSLNPFVDRLTYSAIVELTSRGKVEKFEFAKTVINSKRRFSYEQVQEIITGEYAKKIKEIPKKKSKKTGTEITEPQVEIIPEEIVNTVNSLQKLASTLRKKRMREGSINFSSTEVKIVFDGNNTFPVDIKKSQNDESHQLVEEFMLLANKLVATYIIDLEKAGVPIPFVYRVHDLPDETKQQDFLNVLKLLGFKSLPSQAPIHAKELNKIIEAVQGKPDEALVSQLAVRSMAKAEYSTDNIGHYGLSFKNYTHFTSPIRRYSDLLVHRMLFAVIASKKKALYSKKDLTEICEQISFTERNAADAERQSVKMKQVQFMRKFIGFEFSAVISGVTNYGIFVQIIDYLSEGLIRLRDIEGDYFIYDEKKYSLIGKRTGKVFRLGDALKVKLVRVDESRCEMDFMLAVD